jgi:hypothetical protein
MLLDLRLGGGQALLELDHGVLLRLELRIEVARPGGGILVRLAADVAGAEERLLALRGCLGVLERVLRAHDARALGLEAVTLAVATGLGALQRGLQVTVVEAHDEVAGADAVALAVRQFHDARRYLGGNVDLPHRFHDARCGDGLGEDAVGHRLHADGSGLLGAELHHLPDVLAREQPHESKDHGDGDGDDQCWAHGWFAVGSGTRARRARGQNQR